MSNMDTPIGFHAEHAAIHHAALLDRAIRDSFSGTRSYEIMSKAHRPSLTRTAHEACKAIDAWWKRREARRAAARLPVDADTAETRDIKAWAARAALSSGFGGDSANDDAYVTAA